MSVDTDTLALEAVEGALVDAGIRVATAAADLAPPCAYLLWWSNDAGSAVLAGEYPVVIAVHWVPIRGPQDGHAEAAAAGAITTALAPITVALGVGSRSTVLVSEATTWPCLRWEATVLP
jgi:hypothetical protein